MKRFVSITIINLVIARRDLWVDRGWPTITNEPEIDLTDF